MTWIPACPCPQMWTHNKQTCTQEKTLDDMHSCLHRGPGGHAPGPPGTMPDLLSLDSRGACCGLDLLQLVGGVQIWNVSPAIPWLSHGPL